MPALALALASGSAGWRRSLNLASAELVPAPVLALVRGRVQAAVLDLHDHPVLQADALGIDLPVERRRYLDRLFERNVAAFTHLSVPSRSFAELCGLPAARIVVVPNGTDAGRITPRPEPSEPVVAMVSGAAPGRGIELLLSAVARVRAEIPETTLRLALSATGPGSAAYLSGLAPRLHGTTWVSVHQVPYEGLGTFLGGASVLAVPHPPDPYLDVATPVKLFDSMAAGRAVAVTPRLETRRIVEEWRAGVVAAGDRPDDLAEAIGSLLRSDSLRRTLGENARRCAVERYDWGVLSAGLADAVLADAVLAG
ncbi:MAG: glycosyltransferase, partial [Candidatus Limnocylindria bacterium]